MAETDAERMKRHVGKIAGKHGPPIVAATWSMTAATYEVARALYQLVEQGKPEVRTATREEGIPSARAPDGSCRICGARDWETDCKHGPQRQED